MTGDPARGRGDAHTGDQGMSGSRAVAVATLLLLAGCGGGDSVTDSGGDPPSVGPDGLLEPEVREAVFEATEAFLDALPPGELDTHAASIAAHLAGFDAVLDAGVGDTPGSAWAVFVDSTVYMVMNGGFPPEEDPAPVASVVPPQAIGSGYGGSPVLASSPAGSSASGPRYRLLNGLGPAFDNFDPRITLAGLLEGHGYSGVTETASLEHLRGNMTDVEVLYFRTHGAEAHLRATDETLGALWTTTARNRHAEVNDAQLFEDMRTRRVGWSTQYDGYGVGHPQHPTRARTHYMITDRFIRHYWGDLRPHALVYLDACEAASFETIIGALASLRASAFVGWTRVTRIGNFATATPFVFDRLLGANAFLAEDPPQRPFDLEAVFAQHIGPGKDHGYDAQTQAELVHSLAHDGPFILRPSIQRMEVDEVADELLIHGLFTEDEEIEVTVGAQSVGVKSRENDRLVIDLPRDAAGDVVVRTQRSGGWIASNVRPLTEWQGEWVYRVEHPYLLGAGLGAAEADCRLDIRADMYPYREHPGQDPIPNDAAFVAMRTSECALTFSGTVTGEGCSSLTFSGTLGLGWMDPSEAPQVWPSVDWDPYPHCGSDFVAFSGMIDGENRTLQADLTMFGCGRISGWVQWPDECVAVDHDWPLIIVPEVVHAPLAVPTDEHFAIQSGSRGVGGGPDGGAWLEWSARATRFAPEPGVTPMTAGVDRGALGFGSSHPFAHAIGGVPPAHAQPACPFEFARMLVERQMAAWRPAHVEGEPVLRVAGSGR